jgi:hypothetical protein
MARFQLLTAHHVAKRPGDPAALWPSGTVVELEYGRMPSVSMLPIDEAGEAARLRSDLASRRVPHIPKDWPSLDLQERYELAIAATRFTYRISPGSVKGGPKVTYEDCDSTIITEQRRRARLLNTENPQ